MIEVINLQKSFGDNKVLDGIDMNIEKERLSLLLARPVPEKVPFSVA